LPLILRLPILFVAAGEGEDEEGEGDEEDEEEDLSLTRVVSAFLPSLAFAASVWHSVPVHWGQCEGLSHEARSDRPYLQASCITLHVSDGIAAPDSGSMML
jgi:hypothetical protein